MKLEIVLADGRKAKAAIPVKCDMIPGDILTFSDGRVFEVGSVASGDDRTRVRIKESLTNGET